MRQVVVRERGGVIPARELHGALGHRRESDRRRSYDTRTLRERHEEYPR
jgi:hypothetical protein